ncbi:MAG: hypothetical protein EOS14_29835 [Mesorhizobium sp.]|nr:MAG: hypothetical protein EOS14_29835 [Mesorhizobium sp.]
MFFKRRTADHLSDDPIIRGDIADRVLKATASNGIPPISWEGGRRRLGRWGRFAWVGAGARQDWGLPPQE